MKTLKQELQCQLNYDYVPYLNTLLLSSRAIFLGIIIRYGYGHTCLRILMETVSGKSL